MAEHNPEHDAVAKCRHCGFQIVAHTGIGGIQWRDEHVPLGAACSKSPSHAHEPEHQTEKGALVAWVPTEEEVAAEHGFCVHAHDFRDPEPCPECWGGPAWLNPATGEPGDMDFRPGAQS